MRETDPPVLTRAGAGLPSPPARVVHIGAGAFHRSHQAWYTWHAADRDMWGIEAFTGRTSAAADLLDAQSGAYTLCTRGPQSDEFEIIGSVVAAADGSDAARLSAAVARPATAMVSLTITEAGYGLGAAGRLDSDSLLAADLDALGRSDAPDAVALRSVPGRLAWAIDERRRVGGGPLAVMSCDNLPDNAGAVRAALELASDAIDPALTGWLRDNVAFVSTSIDRITPTATSEDRDLVAAARGYRDECVVVAEPFSDWTIAGEFPAGRPAWETSGAVFVDDVAPYTARKLWMLNGAHTLIASAGRILGHHTIAEAYADPSCQRWVREYWSDARRQIPTIPASELDRYEHALDARFSNARIRHTIAQVDTDSLVKLRLRALPVLERELASGRMPRGILRSIAMWLAANGVAPEDASAVVDSSLLAHASVVRELDELAPART